MGLFGKGFADAYDARWNLINDDLMIFFPKSICNIFFNVRAVKQAKLNDPILGIAEKALMGLVLFYVLYGIFGQETHVLSDNPQGYPSFFFERGNFNTIRNDAFNGVGGGSNWPYLADANCASFENEIYGQYQYFAPKKDKTDPTKYSSPVKDTVNPSKFMLPTSTAANSFAGNSYFNDDKIRCKQMNFAEIYKKDATVGYVTTFQKETYSTVRRCKDPSLGEIGEEWDCDQNGVRQGLDSHSTVLRKSDGKLHFKTTENTKTKSCTCLELRNYMAIAPEGVAISFFHSYTTPGLFGESGNTANKKGTETGKESHPNTFLKKKDNCPPEGCYINSAKLLGKTPQVVFTKERALALIPAGDKIKLLISQILDIATNNEKNFLDKPPTSNGPTVLDNQPLPVRRIYGMTLNMDLVYKIQSNDLGTGLWHTGASAECDLEISYSDGKVEYSLDAQMHTRQNFDDDVQPADCAATPESCPSFTRVYSELLNRGIMIRFTSKGKVSKFDFFYFVNILVQGLVLLPLANTLITLLATTMSANREIFLNTTQEPVKRQGALGDYAAQVAVACTMLKQWKTTEGGQKKKLTKAEVESIFEGVYTKKQSEELAEQLLFYNTEVNLKLLKDGKDVNEDQLENDSIGYGRLVDLLTPNIISSELLKAEVAKPAHQNMITSQRAQVAELDAEADKKRERRQSLKKPEVQKADDVEAALSNSIA